MAGKGDRPRKVDRTKFETNWDKIFGGRMSMSEPNATREPKGIDTQMIEAHDILDNEEKWMETDG